MKKQLKIINNIYFIILIVSTLMMLIVIVYTLIDLYENSYINISSKSHIEFFLKSFDWCKSIIGSVFVIFSVFYAFQTFKIHYENNLFNNHITPKEKYIYDKLNQIKEQNKQLYNFVKRNGREIMTTIIRNEENNCVNNKTQLKYYFDKFLKNEIGKFEHSEHYGNRCKGDCSTCENTNTNNNPNYVTNSFDNFNLIAFELFCISFEYLDFETDIKNIYDSSRKS